MADWGYNSYDPDQHQQHQPPFGATGPNSSRLSFLTAEELQLSPQELRSYPRWYTDLLIRKGKESVYVSDTMSFLDNFGISDEGKDKILQLFDPNLVTLEPQQFYALLRLASHLLQSKDINENSVYVSAPVPQPKSILSRKRKSGSVSPPANDPSLSIMNSIGNPFRRNNPESSSSSNNNDNGKPKLDINSFTTFMLTGNMPERQSESIRSSAISKKKKKKMVTFDSEPPQVAEAAARSLDELMRQRGASTAQQYLAPPVPQYNYYSQASTSNSSDYQENHDYEMNDSNANDAEEDVAIENTFKNVSIDSVLHHGVSNVPAPDTTFRFHHSNSPSPSPSPQIQIQVNEAGTTISSPPPPPPPRPPPRQATLMTLQTPAISVSPSISPSPAIHHQQNNDPLSQFLPLQPTPTGSMNNPSSVTPQILSQPLQSQMPVPVHQMTSPLLQQQASFLEQMLPHSSRSSPIPTSLSPPSIQLSAPQQQPPPPPPHPRVIPQPVISQEQQNSPYPSIPPPHPPIRRNDTGYRSVSGSAFSSPAIPPPPPPPPPPTRSIGPPLPPHPQMTERASSALPEYPGPYGGAQPNNYVMNNGSMQAPVSIHQTSSAPDLLADMRALQEEVDKINWNQRY